MSSPFISATGQVLMNAKHLIAKADSLAVTYASNAKLAWVYASDIDTNGNANIWKYIYYSLDSSNILNSNGYLFIGQNNQVTFSSIYPMGWDSSLVSNGWIDSDSALVIAQRARGSALRSQFPMCNISAYLIAQFGSINPTIWRISYLCSDDSTRDIQINAVTGNIIQILVMTSVHNTSNQLSPIRIELQQNFPNPFNPTTNILFSLSGRSYVSLKIFDLLGREVASLISEEIPAGSYSRQWNAAKMSSGIYFYRLQAGSFTETKKLVLLR
jgi:hypothetical protein